MKQADERAVTERPRQSGEYLAVRRSQPPQAPPPSRVGPLTYEARAASDLFRLCAAIGHEGWFDAYRDVLQLLFRGWGHREIDENGPYPSGIGDDQSPFAFALAFAPGGTELGFLVEAQSKGPLVPSKRETVLGLNRELADRFNVDLTRFAAIHELLFHGDQQPDFSVWHGVRFPPAGYPAFELHLKPRTHSLARAESLARDALRRLGFGDALEGCFDLMTARPGDTVRALSFDLSNEADARVTAYAEHHGATADELEDIAALSEHHVDGDFRVFATEMVGHAGPYLWKPVTTSVSFVQGAAAPSAVTLHLPMSHYVDSDAIAVQPFARFLYEREWDDLSYRRAVHVFGAHAVGADVVVQTSMSYSRETKGARLATLLSPELFRTR